MMKKLVSSWKKYLLISVLLALGTVFVLPAAAAALQANIWSLGFSNGIMAGGSGESSYTLDPPQGHQRAALWLARQALAVGNPEEAQSIVEVLAKEGDQDALVIRGDALAAGGDFEGAVQVWKGAGNYDVLDRAARQAREENRSQDALLAGRAAWELDPEQGAFRLTFFLSDAGEPESAITLLQQMIATYPGSVQRQGWLLRLGDILRTQKKWQEAVSIYRQVLDEQPKNTAAYIGLGWVYYEQGDELEEALQAFQMVVSMEPKRGEGYFAMGQLMAREGHYAEADAWFDRAITHNPENPWWLLVRANNLRASGNLSEALILYTGLTGSFPDWAPGYYEIAWVYKMDNRPNEALQSIETAVDLHYPQNVWYFWRAGNIYEWVGQQEDAINAYEQALAIAPMNAQAQNALQRLLKNGE